MAESDASQSFPREGPIRFDENHCQRAKPTLGNRL